ncbi:MAG: GNAT family N-acetyltransferase [Spirochaetaceae bacterium]|nr:MAG: GNAT family N-acetyltransferase [Spirochaetaceae bacterium]
MSDQNSDPRELQLAVEWHAAIGEIDREAWDRLARPLKTPFLEWEWLYQLEASGSIQPHNGWIPVHLALSHQGRLVGAAPLYVKTHSMGEFVFDFAWADVAEQLGVGYYPKLVGMSPATPSVGYRFLIADDFDQRLMTAIMLDVIHRFCRDNKLHGTSFLFTEPDWSQYPIDAGFSAWEHQSYLWHNSGFSCFDDYLLAFNKNQRRNIRRERSSLDAAGVVIDTVRAEAAPDSWFSLMYDYYEHTNEQFGPWAAKFLDRPFFEGLAARYRHRLLFVAAFVPMRNNPVGLSFLVHKHDHLVGRYWGADRYIDNLHFNACYYAPIEWSIHNGIATFDPGAGSPHKIRRGFRAVVNRSLHYFYDQRLRAVMESNIERINRHERQQVGHLNTLLPLK